MPGAFDRRATPPVRSRPGAPPASTRPTRYARDDRPQFARSVTTGFTRLARDLHEHLVQIPGSARAKLSNAVALLLDFRYSAAGRREW
jgi:hypothetical protein